MPLNGDNEDICNAIPKAKHIFIYRDLNIAAHSGQRILWLIPSIFIVYAACGNPQALPFLIHFAGTRSKGIEDISFRYDLFLEYQYRLQIIYFMAFNRMRKSGLTVMALRYEDLVKEPDRVLTELMRATNMPESLASEAKKALKVDSQASLSFNKKEMVKFRKQLGEKDPNEELLRDEMQKISKEHAVPGPRDCEKEVFILPGTI